MGWSCTAAAMATWHQWEQACAKSSGIRNVLDTGTGRVCLELVHNQHSDGICGEVWRWADGSTVGSFFIGPDGRPVDFPPVLLPLVLSRFQGVRS